MRIGWLAVLAALAAGAAPAKTVRLSAAILSAALEDPRQAELVGNLENSSSDRWLTYSDFPKVRKTVDAGWLAAYRRQLQRFKSKGLKITLNGAGPVIPPNFFEAYPQAGQAINGRLWEYIEKSTAELFRQIPEADCDEIYLWEVPMLNDGEYFKGLSWVPPGMPATMVPSTCYGPADFITKLLEACARGARGLRQTDPALPIYLDQKNQPGDWTRARPINNLLLQVADRPAMMLFDGTGEYWGQSLVPYCYPEEIQQRVQLAPAENRAIDALGMRVHRVDGHTAPGNFNEVNWYALSRLAKDPDTPIESAISDLPYLESHFLQYGRAAAESAFAGGRRVGQGGVTRGGVPQAARAVVAATPIHRSRSAAYPGVSTVSDCAADAVGGEPGTDRGGAGGVGGEGVAGGEHLPGRGPRSDGGGDSEIREAGTGSGEIEGFDM
jgi:hypothetical protein